jgi:hypothetical protein
MKEEWRRNQVNPTTTDAAGHGQGQRGDGERSIVNSLQPAENMPGELKKWRRERDF